MPGQEGGEGGLAKLFSAKAGHTEKKIPRREEKGRNYSRLKAWYFQRGADKSPHSALPFAAVPARQSFFSGEGGVLSEKARKLDIARGGHGI